MTTNPTAPANRETWLNMLAALMAPRFEELGYPLPAFRVSVGFTSGGKDSNAIGEAWHKSTSGDNRYEIFIRPDRDDSIEVAGVLAHELTHAAVGFEHGHKGAFATVALALGLQRPLTATTPGPEFIKWAQPFIDQLGPIPHAALRWGRKGSAGPRVGRGAGGVELEPEGETDVSTGKKKQTTRLRKCECPECGYTVRVTAKWLDVGPPHCPLHGAMTPAQKDAGE